MTTPRTILRKQLAVVIFFTISTLISGTALAAEFTARIGHLESDQQSRHVYLEKVGAIVAENSGGSVEFLLFPQGQLGAQREMTEGVQLGTLEATVSPAAFLGGFNAAVSILDIPFLLPADETEAQTLRDGPFGEAEPVSGFWRSWTTIISDIWPFVLVNLTVLLLITYVPDIFLFIPSLLFV